MFLLGSSLRHLCSALVAIRIHAPSYDGLFVQEGSWRVDSPHVFVIPTETLPRQCHFQTRQDGASVVNTRDAYTLEWWSGLEGSQGTPLFYPFTYYLQPFTLIL